MLIAESVPIPRISHAVLTIFRVGASAAYAQHMSRRSRRSEQWAQLLDSLPAERAGFMVVLGMMYAPAVIILDLALAVVLSRSIRRSWHARQDGLVTALRAGADPALIGLVGALAVNEVVRALVFRTMIRPVVSGTASSAQRAESP